MARSRRSWKSLGLDLVTLRVFSAAAEEANFARAAERECIALSALSRRISDLEARTGVVLFERHDRGVTLTPAGEALHAKLQNVFALLDGIAADLRAVRDGRGGRIRIQAHISATFGPLPEILAKFLEKYPSVAIEMDEQTNVEILHAVRTGTADIGVVGGTLPQYDLELIPWIEDELVAVIPRTHPLCSKSQVGLGDLLNDPFICMQKDSAQLRLFRKHAEALGGHLQERAHATSFESVRRMVSEGLGVAILPAIAVDPFKDGLKIEARPLAESWARRPLMICVRDSSRLSPVSALFVEFLMAEQRQEKGKLERRA